VLIFAASRPGLWADRVRLYDLGQRGSQPRAMVEEEATTGDESKQAREEREARMKRLKVALRERGDEVTKLVRGWLHEGDDRGN